MKALITGASSGIGKEFAYQLSNLGYEIIAVARRIEPLEKLKAELKNITPESVDLTSENECVSLFKKHPDIDILINCAGIGVHGEFCKTDLEAELNMLNTNIVAVHILTKLYLSQMERNNKGYIMNVSSSASFFVGPVFSSYYASKSYVTNLTRAISYELKQNKSKVKVSAFCPGPVDTEFNNKAGTKAGIGAISPTLCANRAIKAMFKGKSLILPTFSTKVSYVLSKLIPTYVLNKIIYKLQKDKSLN